MTRGTCALLALAITAGCADSRAGSLPPPAPAPARTSAPAPSSAPSSAAAAPGASAAAVAVAYYQALERGAADPARADELARLVDPRCSCRQVVVLLQKLARDRHRLLFGVTVGRPRVAEAAGDRATVVLRVTQTAGRQLDARGKVVRTLPATDGRYALELVRREGRWVVRRITRTS